MNCCSHAAGRGRVPSSFCGEGYHINQLEPKQDCADDRRPFSHATASACGEWLASYPWAGGCGAPGAGKSTLAQAILEALPGRAVVVPMDGFHLANVELARLGRAARKDARIHSIVPVTPC
ncbi:MAG: Uridine kinase family protein YggC homolog [Candidatus Burkholderia crenata]|nr:MAG: Uridine kinase family protein YggC homolog [Candidatus Burkholderia crenata]